MSRVLHLMEPDGIRHFFKILDVPLAPPTDNVENKDEFIRYALQTMQRCIGVKAGSPGQTGRDILNYMTSYGNSAYKVRNTSVIVHGLRLVTSIQIADSGPYLT